MNNQEAFDVVYCHLLTQNKKSERVIREGDVEWKDCGYRSSDGGLKCAIGALIHDSEYNPAFEGRSVQNIRDRVSTLWGVNPLLLQALQIVHDMSPPRLWEERLIETAKFFGLTVPGTLTGFQLKVPHLTGAPEVSERDYAIAREILRV